MERHGDNLRELITRYIRYIIFALSVLMIIMGSAYKSRLIEDISMQQPDKRWSGSDIQSGYIAAYMSDRDALDEETILTFRQSYDNSLKEDSFETSENARLYAEAYSTQGSLYAAKE